MLVEYRRTSPNRVSLRQAQLAQPRRRGGSCWDGERAIPKIHPPVTFGSAGSQGCIPALCSAGSADGWLQGHRKAPSFILNSILLDEIFLWRKTPFLEKRSQHNPALPPRHPRPQPSLQAWLMPPPRSQRGEEQKHGHCHKEQQFLARGRSLCIPLRAEKGK